MFNQKSTETVTLTRPQLQAILEIISQIGGVNRSDSYNDSNSRRYRNDNKLMFTDYSENQSEDRQSLTGNSQWVRHNDNLLTADWDKHPEHNGRASSLVLPNENLLNNQLLSPTSSNSSKRGEFRADSVMTNDTSKESNFRRYARSNDSEFNWNDYQRKKSVALEYSKELGKQNQDNQRRKIVEQQKRRTEEQQLDKRIEEQQTRMRIDFEKERQQIQEKRISAEKKREAVIAAIERTPIIKKRNFLVESPTEPQPVAAIKPQTRAKEISTQTEEQNSDHRYCDTGTQTDVQLLLYLLNEMNLMTKEKSRSEETLLKNSKSVPKQRSTNLSKKYKSNLNLAEEKAVPKRGVWGKKQNAKNISNNERKSPIKSNQLEDDNEVNVSQNLDKTENNKNKKSVTKEESDRNEDEFVRMRRQSFALSSSVDNLFDKKKKRVMSSIDLKSKIHFLPQIGGRPQSRKKWYNQDTFDPNFLS